MDNQEANKNKLSKQDIERCYLKVNTPPLAYCGLLVAGELIYRYAGSRVAPKSEPWDFAAQTHVKGSLKL